MSFFEDGSNGLRYAFDGEGARLYEEPKGIPEWDPTGAPELMGEKALCAAAASEVLGCTIGWWPYYCDWYCNCKRMEHGCDQQCSALAGPAHLLPRVLRKLQEAGAGPVDAKPEHKETLRGALVAWRAHQRPRRRVH